MGKNRREKKRNTWTDWSGVIILRLDNTEPYLDHSGNILVELCARNDLQFLLSLCLSDRFPHDSFFSADEMTTMRMRLWASAVYIQGTYDLEYKFKSAVIISMGSNILGKESTLCSLKIPKWDST